ncbi:unnamed protein product [Arctogadus glacialis]
MCSLTFAEDLLIVSLSSVFDHKNQRQHGRRRCVDFLGSPPPPKTNPANQALLACCVAGQAACPPEPTPGALSRPGGGLDLRWTGWEDFVTPIISQRDQSRLGPAHLRPPFVLLIHISERVDGRFDGAAPTGSELELQMWNLAGQL